MRDEMIMKIANVAQMSKEDVIEKVKEYRIPLSHIYDFYMAFGKFPTETEYNAIAAYGVDSIRKVVSVKQQFKVIHIELETPYKGKKHYYYGSKAAIYQHLPEEIVGIKLESLWNVDLDQEEYKNRLCTIRMGTLRRKSTARVGKVPEQNDDIGIIAKNMANNIIWESAGKYIERIEDELKRSGDVGKAKEIMDQMMEQVSQDVDILKDVLKKE